MAGNSLTINADVIQTAFGDEILPDIMDTVFEDYPVFETFYKSTIKGGREVGKLSKEALVSKKGMPVSRTGAMDGYDGGRLIATEYFRQGVEVFPMGNTVNSGAGTVEAIDNTPIENYTQARWQINFKHQPISLTQQQYALVQAAGGNQAARENRVISLLAKKTESGMKTLIRQAEDDIVGTNTVATSGLLSFTAAFAATGTYGALSRTTYTTWAGNTGTYTSGNLDDPSSSEYLPALMKSMVRTVRNNQASISQLCFFVATGIHDQLSNIYDGFAFDGTTNDSPGNWRFQLNKGEGLNGWEGLTLSGIPVIPVTRMASGKIVLCNMKTFFMVGINGSLLDISGDWKIGENSTVQWNRIQLYSQTVSVNPRQGAVYTAA